MHSFGPHFGEEAPLVGRGGSGTVFFTHCNLRCVFCQNWEISHGGVGHEVEPEELASAMLELQFGGCHNVNLVSPTHVVPQILAALAPAVEAGFSLPLVYNSGGYDSPETLRLLDGVVDIYMPDMKYADDAVAARLSGVAGYPSVNRAAVREMYRQVGNLALDRRGIAMRGLIVRHLVLPNGLAGTPSIVRFLAGELSADVYLNLMDQYRPAFEARRDPAIARPLTRAEFARAIDDARRAGLHRGF
jgi:putative pyruvate formate lyase activating enzyme